MVLDGRPLLSPLFGVGHYTRQLVRAVSRVGPEHHYVIFSLTPVRGRCGDGASCLRASNVDCVVPGWWPSLAAHVRSRLGRGRPVEDFVGSFDLFHAVNYVFAHPLRNAKRVVTVHDLTLIRFPEWHPAERVRRMGASLARSVALADRVLAVSHFTKSDLVRHVGVSPDRVDVVPLAADPSFRPLPRVEVEPMLGRLGVTSDYLLFLGTLEPRKNLARLMDAIELSAGGIGLVVLAGAYAWPDGGLQRRLRGLQAAGRIRVLGYVPDALRPVLLNGARALVYPSLYEGFGLPVLEAMACGTPVLTSTASSLPEVAGDAALLVDPHDVEGLATALQRVWGDAELRADLRERGLRRAALYSWERTARLTLDVYEQLARL